MGGWMDGLPFMFMSSPPPKAEVSRNSPFSPWATRRDGWNRSSRSAFHCCSLPKRQRMKMLESTTERTRVNHAPSGTFVSAEDRYMPSRQLNTRKPAKTMRGWSLQMIRATMETMQVVMKVTRMTQTPYALPSRVVYRAINIDRLKGLGRSGLTLLYTAVTITVPIIKSQFAKGI